jgi:hypothetical protein
VDVTLLLEDPLRLDILELVLINAADFVAETHGYDSFMNGAAPRKGTAVLRSF